MPEFNVTEESLEYTFCEFRCPWNSTCKRSRAPRIDDERVYFYFVAPPRVVDGKCEMFDKK